MTEQVSKVTLDYRFYNGSDDYSDGDIENDLLEYVKQASGKEYLSDYDKVCDILAVDNRWPILYHLSPVRHNILEWYDFDKESSVLEIGAGCGAVTGVLCKKVKRVTSVELSKRRAMVNAYRNCDCDNLSIIVGNFNDITFEEKFDYITLIGVLEYANYFTGGEDSFVSFLSGIRKLLKPNGKLLIAIENKYGMKYFSGRVEDHTGRLFDGIENYSGCDSKVRTFSKHELETIVKTAGMKGCKFYYPFPDYKFPTQIFSDDYLPKAEDLVCSQDTFDNDRIHLFDETAAFAGVVNAHMFDFFSNSFFVEASVEDIKLAETKIYAKMTRERRKDYQIETDIYLNNHSGEKKVVKKSILAEANSHIFRMHECYLDDHKLSQGKHLSATMCKSEFETGKISFEYVKGESLCDSLLESIKAGDKVAFEKKLFAYENLVYDLAQAHSPEQDRKVTKARNMNLDLTFDNIIEVMPGEYRVIDYEWCMSEILEVKYIIFRAVYAFYMRYQQTIRNYYTMRELMDFFGITQEEEEKYYNQNLEFIDYVYDAKLGYQELVKPYRKVVHQFDQRNMHTEYFAQLFVDAGEGYSEANSIKRDFSVINHYQEIVFPLDGKEVIGLRYDPINVSAAMKIRSVEGILEDGTVVSLGIITHNASMFSVYSYLFEDNDPQLILDLSKCEGKKLKAIRIRQRLNICHFDEFAEILRLVNIHKDKKKNYEKEQELKFFSELYGELEKHKSVLSDVDKYFHVTKKMQNELQSNVQNREAEILFSDTFALEMKECITQLANQAYMRKDLEDALRQKEAEYLEVKRELEFIKSTKAYRYLLNKKIEKQFPSDSQGNE